MTDDFATKCAALAVRVAGIDQAAAARLETELRKRHGGQLVKIERPVVTYETITEGLRQGKPVARIATETGVSRATLYRRLKARKSHTVSP